MKLALAFLFQDDLRWLRLHLPVYVASGVFDGIVAVDGGSSDGGADFVRLLGGTVYERPFANDFAAQGNYLIRCCEEDGYDALYRADPDELVSPEDLKKVRAALEDGFIDLIALSRYNFVGDRKHVHASWYPDPQWRAWHLNRGIGYPDNLSVHEVPKQLYQLTKRPFVPHHLADAHILHYGYILPDAERAYKIASYDAIQNSKPMPDKAEYNKRFATERLDIPRKPFDGAQPLDPDDIGVKAPFAADPPSLRLSANATGDRSIEYGWCIEHTPQAFGNKQALDFGSGGVPHLSEHAQVRGWHVTALDYQNASAPRGVTMIVGDILTTDLPAYNLIYCCSTVEHVGLAGRYGVTEPDTDGDLKAMAKLLDALLDGGVLLLTIPVGRDHVHQPMHRIYGEQRLPLLLDGFEVVQEAFWRKLPDNGWAQASKAEALADYTIAVSKHDWRGVMFNLGCFVLRKIPLSC